jgi:hypothetical protein
MLDGIDSAKFVTHCRGRPRTPTRTWSCSLPGCNGVKVYQLELEAQSKPSRESASIEVKNAWVELIVDGKLGKNNALRTAVPQQARAARYSGPASSPHTEFPSFRQARAACVSSTPLTHSNYHFFDRPALASSSSATKSSAIQRLRPASARASGLLRSHTVYCSLVRLLNLFQP